MGYLTALERRRIAAALLGALLVAGLLALADAPPLFDDPPTPAKRAQESVEGFFAAGREGDFERVCELLTRRARAYLQIAGAQVREGGRAPRSCAAALGTGLGDSLRQAKVKVLQVRVSSYRAVAETKLRSPRTEGAEEVPIDLLLEDGDWLIDFDFTR